MSKYSSDKKMQKLFEGFRKTVLSETKQFTMYDPLSLKDPINKAIHGLIRSVNTANSAEDCHANAYQIIMLVSQVIGAMSPISEKQSWYLSAAILRYHEKMSGYKEDLEPEWNEAKVHNPKYWHMSFFDSPYMDKWREIDAKQVEFHKEVESMVGTIEHQGMPDISFLVVDPSDVDDLKGKFVASNLASVNDGTWLSGYGNPPKESNKRFLYGDAIYRGVEQYFEN